MKVLDLQCAYQHSFEGWFASEDDFQAQLVRGLVECPICADKSVQKMPSAPRLNLGGRQPSGTAAEQDSQSAQSNTSSSASAETTAVQEVVSTGAEAATRMQSAASASGQAAFLKALRHVMAHTEDVGNRFADVARAMHYGDSEARSIRGQTSQREAIELLEEGIDVMPLPIPAALKETLQ